MNDRTLKSLIKMIKEGWPSLRTECPQSIFDYWTFKEDLSVEDDIIYKEHRLVMPESEREGNSKYYTKGTVAQAKCYSELKIQYTGQA